MTHHSGHARKHREAQRRIAIVSLATLSAALFIAFGRMFSAGSEGESALSLSPHSPLTAVQVSGPGSGILAGRFIVEPTMGRRPLIRLLDGAQRSIFMEMYILTDQSVRRALERAASQGVDVYVLLEHFPFGMGTQPARVADELRAAGVHVRWSPAAFALTHAKFVVIDDGTALISTANFSRTAFTRNREFLLVIRRAPEVRQISSIFRSDWDNKPVQIIDTNLVVSPQNSRSDIAGLLLTARASVRIYAEEIADARIERSLGHLVRRQVKVRVLLASGQAPGVVGRLRAEGAEIRTPNIPYMHAKVIVVDSRIAFLGSENLSTQSLDHNREVGLMLRGDLVARLVRTFDRDWEMTSRR